MLRPITSPDPHPSSIAAFAPRMSNDENRAGGTGGPATSVITKVKPKAKRPNLYRVLILNDDYTPMEFVVHVLEKFFQKDVETAQKIMLHVHHHGIGECGIFTYEIAEMRDGKKMMSRPGHKAGLSSYSRLSWLEIDAA